MDSSAKSWLEVLASAGVIALFGRACEAAFRWFVRRPLQREEAARARAERDTDHWRARYVEAATELKATTTALLRAERADKIASGAKPESLPPMRDEMPTLQCFVDGPQARAWAEERERAAEAATRRGDVRARRAANRSRPARSPRARPVASAPPARPLGCPRVRRFLEAPQRTGAVRSRRHGHDLEKALHSNESITAIGHERFAKLTVERASGRRIYGDPVRRGRHAKRPQNPTRLRRPLSVIA